MSGSLVITYLEVSMYVRKSINNIKEVSMYVWKSSNNIPGSEYVDLEAWSQQVFAVGRILTAAVQNFP